MGTESQSTAGNFAQYSPLSGLNATPTGLPLGRFQGRTAFEETIRAVVEVAAREGWTQMCWMDADFADWPLGERRVEVALQAWSRTGRQMVLMARSFDMLMAKHHRFVSWRRQWAHIIVCWQCPQAPINGYDSAIVAPNWCLRRLNPESGLCVASELRSDILALQDIQQAWLEKSSSGFPATVLGL